MTREFTGNESRRKHLEYNKDRDWKTNAVQTRRDVEVSMLSTVLWSTKRPGRTLQFIAKEYRRSY